MTKIYSLETLDEAELVRRVISGDEAAKNHFCERFRQRLYVTAVALLGYQDPEAEDMVHETLLSGLKALPGFEFRASLKTWLNHICVNLCLKALKRRQRLIVQADEDITRIMDGASAAKPADGPAIELVKNGLARLKGACREILGLRYERDLEYGSISMALKVPVGTVMSRLSRCRQLLKSELLKLKKAGHG
jgi:RNA polymerase sigma-70 factor (ECF subfamily)